MRRLHFSVTIIVLIGRLELASSNKSNNVQKSKDRILPKLTTTFFNRPMLTAILWLVLTVFGALSYTSLLKREGFPNVNISLAIVGGTYFVNDPSKVDENVAKPIADLALKQSATKSVQSSSADNFFTVSITYKDGTDAKQAAKELESSIKSADAIPKNVNIQYNVPYFGATGPDTDQLDMAISFYSDSSDQNTNLMVKKASQFAKSLEDKQVEGVKAIFVKNPIQKVVNPKDGNQVEVERSFDRFGIRNDNKTKFYNSVIIGISKKDGSDVIKLDDKVRSALSEISKNSEFAGYHADVSASFASQIKDNISELQRVLLEGLIAVLVIGSLVIALRASLITVVSMITVISISLGLIFLVGYTLNVITLFALILGLALIVDDTIIMVEAIDAARRKSNDPLTVVKTATQKISRAMVAATLTAALSFSPLLFVGGVLGSFIKAIPVVIISSLLISLIVALVFIPFFSRFVLLSKKQLGKKAKADFAAGIETKLAEFIARPMLWARHSTKKLFLVGSIAVLVGLGFIGAGLNIGKNVVFNIFPPTKDTNGINITLNFPRNTDLQKAKELTTKADAITSEVIGENFIESSYYNTGSAQSASLRVALVPYSKRNIKSPKIVEMLQSKFNNDFKEAGVKVGQVDVGPPIASFIIQLDATDRQKAYKAANDVSNYLPSVELKRSSGKIAHMKNITISSPDQYSRKDGKLIVVVSADFDGSDTTTLVNLAQQAVNKEFDSSKLASYGLDSNALSYNLGQETENQNSFKALVFAFPLMLLAMYLLLLLEFRSLLQPLLIFMAIPFSIFGIMLGLDVTKNAISFFAMLGFFALVGLSIKNTILLTDFANQSRRSGLGVIDSAVAALEERFRPLFATSVTAVVSLIPLAVLSPFWQGLAVVLIFGLLSSTFLVITVFPYYYIGAEYLRQKISPKNFLSWIIISSIVAIIISRLFSLPIGLLSYPLSLLLLVYKQYFVARARSHK